MMGRANQFKSMNAYEGKLRFFSDTNLVAEQALIERSRRTHITLSESLASERHWFYASCLAWQHSCILGTLMNEPQLKSLDGYEREPLSSHRYASGSETGMDWEYAHNPQNLFWSTWFLNTVHEIAAVWLDNIFFFHFMIFGANQFKSGNNYERETRCPQMRNF